MRAALFALGLVLGARAGWELARWVVRLDEIGCA